MAWNVLSEVVKDGWNERAEMKGSVMGVNLFMGDYIKGYWTP